MAASSAPQSWRQNLDSHPVCKYLKKINTKDSTLKHHTETKSLLSINGSDLFIWDFSDSSILHCNLRNFDPKSKHDGVESDKLKCPNHYQKFILSDSHGFNVESISINRCCSHILAWGPNGIRIVELPRRWGAGAVFEGGKNIINCRTTVIGERNFHGNHSLKIRQAKWHPGSQTHSHVAILTSDNVFRVYDISDPNQPVSSINIDTPDTSVGASPSKVFVGSALGEIAVSFDFGAAISMKPKQRPFGKNSLVPVIEVWPVYCVRGNGDVMLLYSHLSNYSPLRLPVHGPLSMYPPAEDNYGVDACYILCLNTPMPVLAVSTCDGRLHHCVQLDESPEDNEGVASESDQTSSSPGCNLYEPIREPILFVIESAELELCLSVGSPLEQSGVEEEFFMCPIQLQNDVNSHDRYYCVHKAGVHSVALPWLSVVQQYFLDGAEQLELTEEKECVVEHLFCTKPLHSCPSAPVLGVDVVSDPVLGPTLVILSSDYDFTALPIGFQYQTNSTLLLDREDPSSSSSSSSSNKPLSQPFSQYIAKILQRKTSNPLLRSSTQTEPSQQECFQLLSRATQILREEYIEKQDHAREEIDTRISILGDIKVHQLQDIKRLSDTNKLLTEHARNVADRLNGCSENYDTLRQRLDAILHKLQGRVPHLSEAERNLLRELKAIQLCIQGYKKDLEAVSNKMQYQERQMKKTGSVSSPVLQEKQLNQIRNILKEESHEIEDLKKDIGQIGKEMS